MPPPISSQPVRCWGDASASRGNHTRGTETTLPSVSVTESASVEHDTSTASASVFSVKVVIPPLQEEPRTLNNYFPNVGHLIRSTPLTSATDTGSSQNFAYRPAWVTWMCGALAPLHAEKEEPIPPDPEKSGTAQVYPVGRPSELALAVAGIPGDR